jgi:hypothetical protein
MAQPHHPHPSAQAAVAELAGLVFAGQTPDAALHQAVRVVAAALTGVEEVSLVLLAERGTPHVAFAGALAAALDDRQYGVGHGPALDAATTRRTVEVRTWDPPARYEDFAVAARQHGIVRTRSTGLGRAGAPVGALTLYRTSDEPFPEPVVALLAGPLTAVLANLAAYHQARHQADHLELAMRSRATIEQAVGVIVAAEGCCPETAWQLLVRLSQRSNTKVHRVAQLVVQQAGRAGSSVEPSGAQPPLRRWSERAASGTSGLTAEPHRLIRSATGRDPQPDVTRLGSSTGATKR